jgi:hypothetical protein
MMKKGLMCLIIVFAFLLGNSFPTSGADAKVSIESLQKQIKDLSNNLKAKEKEITVLKASSAKASKTKVAYNGSSKGGLIEYKNITYMPVTFVKDVLNVPVTSDQKANTIYFGAKPNGSYMSDLLKPYYFSGYELELNGTMVMGDQKYYKGYSLSSYGDFEVVFNLAKKYTKLSGKIGFDDSNSSASRDDYTVKVFGDDELIETIEIDAAGLPVDFNLDISNINKLNFTFDGDLYKGKQFDLVNVIIQ